MKLIVFTARLPGSWISDLENRRRGMTDEMARRLAQVLDVPVSWLS